MLKSAPFLRLLSQPIKDILIWLLSNLGPISSQQNFPYKLWMNFLQVSPEAAYIANWLQISFSHTPIRESANLPCDITIELVHELQKIIKASQIGISGGYRSLMI